MVNYKVYYNTKKRISKGGYEDFLYNTIFRNRQRKGIQDIQKRNRIVRITKKEAEQSAEKFGKKKKFLRERGRLAGMGKIETMIKNTDNRY